MTKIRFSQQNNIDNKLKFLFLKKIIMNRKVLHFGLFLYLILFFTSCLTVEKKIYTFELKDNNSGTLTIKFINIMSMKDDTTDVSASDFEELVMNYIDGTEFDQDYPEAIIRSKKLFEENGELCGEVIIDFENLKSVGLFQYEQKGPYMFNVGSFLDSETYLTSNGEYGGEVMPVVFWPKSLSSLSVTTYVTTPDESTLSLLNEYLHWD